MKSDKRLYFAFGSNLRHAQIKKRCPHARFLGPAKVNAMRLAFTGYSLRWRGAPATIVSNSESVVWGAIFELDTHCVKRLDRFEGLTTHKYHHKMLACIQEDGTAVEAYTYVRKRPKSKEKQPSRHYLSSIIKGAHDCKLPTTYIKRLESIKT